MYNETIYIAWQHKAKHQTAQAISELKEHFKIAPGQVSGILAAIAQQNPEFVNRFFLQQQPIFNS